MLSNLPILNFFTNISSSHAVWTKKIKTRPQLWFTSIYNICVYTLLVKFYSFKGMVSTKMQNIIKEVVDVSLRNNFARQSRAMLLLGNEKTFQIDFIVDIDSFHD